MNKVLFSIIGTLAAVSAFAQGSVNVNNRFGSPAVIRGVSLPGGALVAGAEWQALITYGAANTALGSAMNFRPAGTLAGAWVPTSNGGANDRVMDGVAAGSTVSLTVNVWDSNRFASWGAAAAAIAAGGVSSGAASAAGSSTFSYSVPSGDAALNPGNFNMANFQAFSLTALNVKSGPVVPEPTTIALGALGAAALLWRRRK